MPRIQHKRGTSANLASVNPTPLAGELVWDSTENAIKIGDGATAWTSLAYVTATPRTHTHSADAITSGTVAYARLPVGSTTSTVCAGDDARLSDTRTPTAHKSTHATGGSDALTPSDIGAAPAASPTFTGVVTIPVGSNSAPSLTFAGDTNTGLFQAASEADTLSVSAGGSEVARFGGIRINVNRDMLLSGTTSTISGNAGVMFASGSNHFRLAGNATSEFTVARVSSLDTATDEDACFRVVSLAAADTRTTVRVGAYTDNNRPQYSFIADTNTGIANVAADALSAITGGSERLRVDSSGRLGIATTSPTATLDVNADTMRLRTARTPASASATGNAGDICWDADYLYVCTATNTWRRISHASW